MAHVITVYVSSLSIPAQNCLLTSYIWMCFLIVNQPSLKPLFKTNKNHKRKLKILKSSKNYILKGEN